MISNTFYKMKGLFISSIVKYSQQNFTLRFLFLCDNTVLIFRLNIENTYILRKYCKNNNKIKFKELPFKSKPRLIF